MSKYKVHINYNKFNKIDKTKLPFKGKYKVAYFTENLNCIYYNYNKVYVLQMPTFIYYLNYNGELHREDGFAYIESTCPSIFNRFYLNDKVLFPMDFANKTNHIICGFCKKFCKQECFN